MADELNKYRREWYIDWDFLIDPDNDGLVRRGDTLTINCLEDLGPKSIHAACAITILNQRGIDIRYEAICDDGLELIGRHQLDHVQAGKLRKMRRAKANGANQGGRPRKYTEQEIRWYHERVRTGKDAASKLQALYGIAPSTMADNCKEYSLTWPITVFDSQQGSEGQ